MMNCNFNRKAILENIAWLFLTVFLLFSFMPVSAYAETEEVRVAVTVEPGEVAESQPVSLEFTVSNYSDFQLNEIALLQDGNVIPVEHIEDIIIPPNGSAQFSVDWTVPDSRIGLETVFTVSYVKYGETYLVEVPVKVERASDPVIEVSRKVSQEFAKPGETVTLTYELVNSTVFDMTDITLYDSGISNSPILRNHTLNAGGSVTQSFVYTMGEKDAETAPIVTYEVNGNTKTFSAVEPVKLNMVNVSVSMDVEMGTPSILGVPFTITVENDGNTDVRNISIVDERGNRVTESSFSLKPGNQYALTYTVVPLLTENSRNVRFSLNGVDAYGSDYELDSKSAFTVYPYIEDSQVNVMMTAEATGEWQQATGTVGIRVTITNLSEVILKNAALSEAQMGELAVYEQLNDGTTVFEGNLVMGTPRNLSFALIAFDPAGTQRQLTAASLLISQPAATPEPTEQPSATQAPVLEPEPIANGISKLIITIVVAVGGIIVLALVVVILLYVLEHKQTGGINLDIDDEDEQEEAFDLIVEEEPASEAYNGKTKQRTRVMEHTQERTGERPRSAQGYMQAATERRTVMRERQLREETGRGSSGTGKVMTDSGITAGIPATKDGHIKTEELQDTTLFVKPSVEHDRDTAQPDMPKMEQNPVPKMPKVPHRNGMPARQMPRHLENGQHPAVRPQIKEVMVRVRPEIKEGKDHE